MIVVDASVWVGLVLPSDLHYPATRRWYGDIARATVPMTAPNLMLVEIAGAIARQTGSTQRGLDAVRLYRQAPHATLREIDEQLAGEAIDLAATLSLRGADATYVALVRRLGIPLVSWDKDHLDRTGGVVSVYTPATYPFPPATT